VDAVARSGRRKVGSAHARRNAAGTARLLIRVSRKTRRGTLAVGVTVRRPGAPAQTIKRTVKVR
jgi:hypothetical protein